MIKMDTFGTLKSKIVKKLTEAYINGNKGEIKEIVSIIKKDKNFKDLFLFYEDIENKYFEDAEVAKLYVEEINALLKNKNLLIEDTCKILTEKVADVVIENNKVYDALDQLLSIDNLKNIDKKVIAKRKIIEIITTNKKLKVNESVEFTGNEKLLHTILTNNFNAYYDMALNEEEKKELKFILSMDDEQLSNDLQTIKETILSKLENLITESKDDILSKKLNDTKIEVNETDISKYSYYRMKKLLSDIE